MTIETAKEYLKSILDYNKNVPENMRDCTGASISLKNIEELYNAISQEKAELKNPLTVEFTEDEISEFRHYLNAVKNNLSLDMDIRKSVFKLLHKFPSSLNINKESEAE